MAIFELQVLRLHEEILLNALREGRQPSVREVGRKLAEFMKQADGGPTFRPKFQTKSRRWDHLATNEALKQIHFDLSVAYDEVVGRTRTLLGRSSFVEISYQSQRQQIQKLLSLLDNLLLTAKNTEDNFFGVFDSFDDLSKVNQDLSSKDVVDLEEGVAALPFSRPTATRIDMAHLYSARQWPILAIAAEPTAEVVPPDGAAEKPAPPGGRQGVIQNETVDQGWFGNAWSDTLSTWRHIVTTTNPNGATIEFTIPVAPRPDEEISITRISLRSASVGPVSISVLHSRDNVNYIRLPNVAEESIVQPGSTLNLDFETTQIEFLKFRVTMEAPSVSQEASHSYIFGFRSMGLYKLGRAQQAELVSQPLQPSSMSKAIDKVALTVEEDIPAGCDVDYFVAPGDEDGLPRDGIWIPIQPVGRPQREGIPALVTFAESATVREALQASNPQAHETVRNVVFYELNEIELDHEPLFGQARLFRGENAWWRNTQREVVIRTTTDCFVDFNSGDTQRLYVIRTDEPEMGTSEQTWDGLTTGVHTMLTVPRRIDYIPEIMTMIPDPQVDPTSDHQPRYAIYRVERIRDTMRISDEAVELNGTAWSQLENFGVSSLQRPIVTNQAGTVIYTEGVDYTLEPAEGTNGTVLSGRIKRTQTSTISTGATVLVTYTLESDITYLVAYLDSQEVHLSQDLGSPPDQHFRVTYRATPLPPEIVIRKSTLRATDSFGSDEGQIFKEGPDYSVDINAGTITRISTGAIQGDLSIYVDFDYETKPQDLDTFTTWVFVEKKTPVILEFNALDLDVDAGERVAIDGFDITQKTETPELEYGWHQVIVRSHPPETRDNAAIKQIAALRDRDNEIVFIAGGVYFARMLAQREPMRQRTYAQLTKATPRGDHGYFAIVSGQIILNFEPGTTEEIYTYGYRLEDEVATIDEWDEEFTLEYTYALDSVSPVDSILVRALLRRSANADGALTPKIHAYHVRLA